MSFLFLPVLLVWVLLITYIHRPNPAKIFTLLLSGVIGIGLSGFFLLPVILEKDYVHIESLTSGYFGYLQHFVSLFQLFISNHFGYGSSQLGPGDDLSLSLGLVHWILAGLAVVLAAIQFKTSWAKAILVLSAIEIFVIFLMHAKSTFIWQLVSPLQYLQFPWRFLIVSNFLMSFLAVYFIRGSKYFGILAILAVILLHGNFFQPQRWSLVTDQDLLTGPDYIVQLTASIFDYLPTSAQLPPNLRAPAQPEILTGQAQVISYSKASDWQTGLIQVVSADTQIRIPMFDFPGMLVRVDGQPVSHSVNCIGEPYCFGLISFTLNSGLHTIMVQLTNTPIRTIGNTISIISLLALAQILWNSKKFSLS